MKMPINKPMGVAAGWGEEGARIDERVLEEGGHFQSAVK